ncbi:MAG: 6-phosphofructokinase [Candidatus Omnitrophota bacterium]
MNIKKIKRIAVLTSGGDCSGMNAAIRSVVRSGIYHGLEVYGVFRGYEGLMSGDIKKMTRRSVGNIIGRGGTFLKTARSSAFLTEEGRNKAIAVLKEKKIDALVVIGGDGSFRGAHVLSSECKIQTIGIPGTIDNDLNGTDFSIGTDTAVNVALGAIDKIRDTATSLERIFVVEVMGHNLGYIALQVGLAGGAEEAIVPEFGYDINAMVNDIKKGRKKGKISWIIIVAEGAGSAGKIGEEIKELSGFEVRVVVLGHIQRGGDPTSMDRILAARFGEAAIEALLEGHTGKMVGIVADKIKLVDFEYACKGSRNLSKEQYKLLKILSY